jgi:hypothetical protein
MLFVIAGGFQPISVFAEQAQPLDGAILRSRSQASQETLRPCHLNSAECSTWLENERQSQEPWLGPRADYSIVVLAVYAPKPIPLSRHDGQAEVLFALGPPTDTESKLQQTS